jgi:hypothetical protein
MKIKFSLCAMLALAFAVFACSDEPSSLQKEKVQFSLDIQPSESSGGRTNSEVPDGARVLISLSNSSGTVLTRHPLVIHQFGSGHTTDPLELPVGNYSLTEFLIEDINGNIVMATPKKESTLGDAISSPLPIAFNVEKGNIVNLEMEVVPVDAHNPADFGYAAFSIDVFDPLPIVVFVEQHGALIMTEARATFSRTVPFLRVEQDLTLDASVNYIDFDGPHDELYHLRIYKEGYSGYSTYFKYQDIINTLGSSPWKIILRETEVVKVERPATTSVWNINIGTLGNGALQVVWSDGTVEDHVFQGAPGHQQDNFTLSHTYESENGQDTQHVWIRGDLSKIFWFRVMTGINSLDIKHLGGLETLMLNRANLQELDLSQNGALRDFILDKSDIVNLTLGHNPKLKSVAIHESGTSVATYDELAKELYENVVANNLEFGQFDGHNIPMGPVAKGYLTQIRDDYKWTVYFPQ